MVLLLAQVMGMCVACVCGGVLAPLDIAHLTRHCPTTPRYFTSYVLLMRMNLPPKYRCVAHNVRQKALSPSMTRVWWPNSCSQDGDYGGCGGRCTVQLLPPVVRRHLRRQRPGVNCRSGGAVQDENLRHEDEAAVHRRQQTAVACHGGNNKHGNQPKLVRLHAKRVAIGAQSGAAPSTFQQTSCTRERSYRCTAYPAARIARGCGCLPCEAPMLPTASTMRKRDGSEPHNHARGAPSSGGKHKKRQATRRLYRAGTTTGGVDATSTSTAGGGVSAASLEDSASWLSWLTFSWCNPFIDALYRGAQLTEADLPPPAAGDDPSEVVRAFDDEWKRCRDQSKPLALASTLFRVHRRRYGLFCGVVCPSPVNTARSHVSACWVGACVWFMPIYLRGHPASLLMALCWQVFGVVSSLCKPLVMARMLDVFATWASVADGTADATAAALAPSLGHALWLCALLTFASAGQSTGDQTVCRCASTAWQNSSPMRVGVCMCVYGVRVRFRACVWLYVAVCGCRGPYAVLLHVLSSGHPHWRCLAEQGV